MKLVLSFPNPFGISDSKEKKSVSRDLLLLPSKDFILCFLSLNERSGCVHGLIIYILRKGQRITSREPIQKLGTNRR